MLTFQLSLTRKCQLSPPPTSLLVRVSEFFAFADCAILECLVAYCFNCIEIAADSLKGRVFEISLADLNPKEATDRAWRKMKVQVEEVKGFDCYTNFYGMDMTRDKLCTLVKKWHTLVEAFVQAKTNDGYLIRMFCIGFTKRHRRQVKATVYAKNSQQKLIRQKMMEIMVAECQKSTLKELFDKL